MQYEQTKPTARDKYIGRAPKAKTVKHIAIQDGEQLGRKAAKRTMRMALKHHRQSIKRLRHDIKKHKLLAKQARLVYKITK